MLWQWQALEAVLQKMQRCSEFIAFHDIILAGYTVFGFRSSSTKFTALDRTLAGRAQGMRCQMRPPIFLAVVIGLFGLKNQIDGFQGNKGGN